MSTVRIRTCLIGAVCVGIFGVIAFQRYHAARHFGHPLLLTGWSLFGLFILLASFNARKRLSMLPVGNATTWLLIHVGGGILALAIFWLHTRTLWPRGLYEQVLALLFYLLTANGLLGYFLQRIYPSRLTQTGIEIIYERIPAELADIRHQAEALVLASTQETASEVLAQHYQQTFSWFFQQPRFIISHLLGGLHGEQWIRYHCSTVERYLNTVERGYLDRLARLARLKQQIDIHYAVQSVMKGWLLIHLPLAAAVLTLVMWHILLVHIYAV